MRLPHRSLKFKIGVLVVMVVSLFATALAVNAQSNIRRPLSPEAFVIDDSVQQSKSATYRPLVPNGNGQWTESTLVNAPGARYKSSYVWTGKEVIVWGGQYGYIYNGDFTNAGARYNPRTDVWQPTSLVNAPSKRYAASAVWTGTEMIIGTGSDGGGRYNPVTDSWLPISSVNSPSGGAVVWTGKEMLVWSYTGTGGRYDPALDLWRPITTTNAPSGPAGISYVATQAVVWTGREMIVYYSCPDGFTCTASGGRYDPETDTWQSISLNAAPVTWTGAAAVWTGKEMVVYGGGFDGEGGPNLGARYNPTTNTWVTITPSPYFEHTMVLRAVWTGNEVMFAGNNYSDFAVTVASYDPVTDQWTSLPHPACEFGSFIWTGNELFLWGNDTNGCAASDDPRTAQLYTPPYQNLRTLTADSDTFIAQGQPNGAFGSEQLLWTGYDPQYKYYTERVLTQFPLAIPSRATVTQATAYLYHYAYSKGATPMNITAYQVTAPWGEGSTWNTSAYSYNPIGGSTVSVGTTFGWYNWNVTSIAQKWVNGTAPNYGLMLNGNESGARNERVFIAREANTTYTPFLAVSYTDPYYAVDTTPPTAAVKPMPALQATQTPLAVQWSGSDQGRGVQSFDVQVRDNNGGWTDWYAWAVGTSAPFIGQDGHTYCFRVRARDYAGNVGNYVAAPGCVTFYSTAITLNVTDAGHAPIADATINVTPAPLSVVNIANGRYQAYLTTSPSYQLTITHPYLIAPPSAILDQAITEYTVVLQPTDNVIQNSNFETDLSDWSLSGTLPITITTVSHSGHGAAGFDGSAATQTTASLSQTVLLPDVEQPLHLSFLYALTSTVTSPFTVDLITTNGVTPVFSTTAACPNWCHQGLDVSAWRNQTVTLVFQLNQAAGESAHLSLDEVTLGTWQTPIVAQVTPARVDANSATTITLNGLNFLAQPLNAAYITGPIVLLNSTPVETYWINTTTLTATLPLTLPFGLYDIWVANPGGYRGELPSALRIGHGVYLPVISK